MTAKIRLSKSCLGPLERELVGAVLDEEYLGMGRWVERFENDLSAYLDGRPVACVNTGTSALHLAVMSLRAGAGAEVLVQSLTFVASFQAIRAAGAVPVACEVSPDTCTIDLEEAARRITDRTVAIMPVHYASRPGDLGAVYRFAAAHGLRVVEDAAHAFGSMHEGRRIGSTGDIVCFSFDGIKNITCGEGGAVVTEDPDVLEFVREARLLGVQKDTEKRYSGQRSWEFDVVEQGYRYHMSNVMAAIGLAQLQRLEGEFVPRRRDLARTYQERLSAVAGLQLFPDDFDDIVPHIYPIRVLDGRRDAVRSALEGNGIQTGIHFFPNHWLTLFGDGGRGLPVTEKLYEELLTLPLHPDVSDGDLDRVVHELTSALREDAPLHPERS